MNQTEAMPREVPERLDVGRGIDHVVAARDMYNPPPLLLQKGDRYRFEVGEADDWRDASITTSPAGYDHPPYAYLVPVFLVMRPFRRFARGLWFQLVGGIEYAGHTDLFPVGMGPVERDVQDDAPRRIILFANDLPGKYDNNHGQVALRITRLA